MVRRRSYRTGIDLRRILRYERVDLGVACGRVIVYVGVAIGPFNHTKCN